MNNQIEGKHTLVIVPGIYRVIEVAEAFGVSRSSINRYVSKFDIPLEDIEYQGKVVKGLILDEVAIHRIEQAVNQGDGQRSATVDAPMDNQRITDDQGEQSLVNHAILLAESKLELANQKIEDLKALLVERNRVIDSCNKIIESKDGEISTLKTSMVMLDQLKRYGALDVGDRKPNPLARLGQWLGGLRKPSQPAASYQQIDPVVEPVEEEEHANS